jgi:hypothetical protein
MDNVAGNAHGSDFGDLRALYVNCTLKRSEWDAGCRWDNANPEHR